MSLFRVCPHCSSALLEHAARLPYSAGNKASVFARASYEETVKHFVNASVFGERDPLKGVSENILIGKQINVGTGRIKLAIKKEDLKKVDAEK